MKIYYRGYVISRDNRQEPAYTVQGVRPQRETLAFEGNPRAAMRWIDREVIRQKVRAAGWLNPQALQQV